MTFPIDEEDQKWDSKHLAVMQFPIRGFCSKIPLEIVRISQKQDTRHHGTTVWDSAKILVKYFERNIHKSPQLLQGRWIELGAGCGLMGISLVALGVDDITVTDQPDVMSLLRMNCAQNLCQYATILDAEQSIEGMSDNSRPRVTVAPLFWGNINDMERLRPPFDRIVATDVIYERTLLDCLIQTLIRLSRDGTEILIGHEMRDKQVYDLFVDRLAGTGMFSACKRLPRSRMHPDWQHPMIEILRFKRRSSTIDNNRA